jgi:HK97 gp10 family phage protein
MATKPVIVTGSEELNRKLADLKGSKAKQAIRKASREALRPVAAAAKANAPRRTGLLAQSIKVRALKRSRVRVGSQVTANGANKKFNGRQFYGGFQEYGWKAGRRAKNADIGAATGARRTKSQKSEIAKRNNARRKIDGTEFMARAAKDKKELALQIYAAETTRWIHEFSKK